jgi:hypothetical protein
MTLQIEPRHDLSPNELDAIIQNVDDPMLETKLKPQALRRLDGQLIDGKFNDVVSFFPERRRGGTDDRAFTCTRLADNQERTVLCSLDDGCGHLARDRDIDTGDYVFSNSARRRRVSSLYSAKESRRRPRNSAAPSTECQEPIEQHGIALHRRQAGLP